MSSYSAPPGLAADIKDVITAVAPLWEELRGGRLFVTGGTGFFGRWLLESFVAANRQYKLGASVVVLSRDPARFASSAPSLAACTEVSFMKGDVVTLAYEQGFGEVSHVIHAATDASARLNDEAPLQMLDTIVYGTRRTLEFARAAGAKKFLLTSSGAIYGLQPPDMGLIPETYGGGLEPVSLGAAYGEGKRLAELLMALYHGHYGLETKIARCFAFVGPFMPLHTHFAMGNFIRDAIETGTIVIGGDGRPLRSYLYASDLAIWLWSILFKGRPATAYNVGSERPIAIADLAQLVARLAGSDVGVEFRPVKGNTGAGNRYLPDTSRARQELGLLETVSLEDAVYRTIAWSKQTARPI